MSKLIYSLAVFAIAFSSCQSEETVENGNESENTSTNTEVNTSKFEELAVDPCNLLTEEMVTTRFGVDADELKLNKYASNKGKISWTANCTYSWKKPDFEAISQRNTDKMIAAMTSGDTKNAMNVATSMEKDSYSAGVTNLKVYDDAEKALKLFNQSHTVPEQKDLDQLNKAIDEETNPALTEEGKEVGKDVVGGIASNLKFDQVDGIGTIAYWDHLGGKLDVLFGTIQIGIIMHISDNHDENVAAAKALAEEIIGRF
jgi:hypothetical protein